MSAYKTINARGKEVFTDLSLHPEEIRQMEIEARKLKRTDAASDIGMRASHFSELLHWKRHT